MALCNYILFKTFWNYEFMLNVAKYLLLIGILTMSCTRFIMNKILMKLFCTSVETYPNTSRIFHMLYKYATSFFKTLTIL